MSRYTRGLLAVILAVVLVLPAAAFAMLPEANARSSTGMDGPAATRIADYDTSNHWKFWAGGYDGSKVTTQNVGRIWTDKTVQAIEDVESDFSTTLSALSSTSETTSLVSKPLDIVLVLDASGSMDDPMGGGDSTKRIDALRSAACGFIDTIAAQNKSIKDANKQHKVAIVKFAGEQTDKVGNDTYHSDGYFYNCSQTMMRLTDCSEAGATDLKEKSRQLSLPVPRAPITAWSWPRIFLLDAKTPRRSLCSLRMASPRALTTLALQLPTMPSRLPRP